ncbi:MAG: hypothetical protein ILO36_06995 [Abditibacteriota bacterium]|nr:hypothetical protein [Abditibacteriota bacterium]
MKKHILIIAAVLAAVLFASGCHYAAQDSASRNSASPETPAGSAPLKAVVVYFSVTGNTKTVADYIASAAGADIWEIVPERYYSKEDLDYMTPGCRSSEEFKDPSARPEMDKEFTMSGDYQVIFLGFPIWYGTAPKILFTFLESVDLKGKTVVPFCTSGSSGIDKALEDLLPLGKDAVWLKGKRFPSHPARTAAEEWVKSLGLNTTGSEPGKVKDLQARVLYYKNTRLSGNVMVRRFPISMRGLYTEQPYATDVNCFRERIEDAVFIELNQSQFNGLASVGLSYRFTEDPVTDVIEKDPGSALKEFRRVDYKDINKDFSYALYDTGRFTAGKERGFSFYSDRLAVIRYKGRIVWFKILTREGEDYSRIDAKVLADGRILVATPYGAYYVRENDGRAVTEFYRDYAEVGRGDGKKKDSDRPLPKIEILTDNIVKHYFDDGREEYWQIRLSKTDIQKNLGKNTYEVFDCRKPGSRKYLLWWNGKGGSATALYPDIESCKMWCYTQGER